MANLKMLPYSTEKVKLRNKNLYTSTVDNNEGHKRYFSSIDSEIYFGDIFIDDINRIEYEVVEKTLPIFGYNSRRFDFLMQGVRYVQGEFTINFTKSGWLLDVTKGLGSIVGSGNGFIAQCQARENSCGNTDSDMFPGMFDIIVSFGDHKSTIRSYGSSAHMIKGVKIIGYRQMLDVSGEPIGETYSFIAYDIDFDIDTSGGLDNTFTTGNNNTFAKYIPTTSKSTSVSVSYARNTDTIAKAKTIANTEDTLAMSVDSEHTKDEKNIGHIVSTIKILNSNIDKEDIKIKKLSISSNDRRSDLRNLPIIKSTEYKYSNNDIIVDIPLSTFPIYDKKLTNLFTKERENSSVDVNVSIDVEYKGAHFSISNQPVKITPGGTYNF